MEERHLSLSEAARRLDISERTARRWIKSGKLRAYKPGRDYWIPGSAIKEVVEESKVLPKEESRSSLEPRLFNGPEGERSEHEQDLDVALSLLVEDCTQQGRELEKHLKTLDHASPVSAYPFYEKLFALDVVLEQLARGKQLAEEFREAKQHLDKIAERIDTNVNQLMRPSNVDSTRARFVERGIAARRRKVEGLEQEVIDPERQRLA